jgi:hypothetical protein
MNVIYIAANGHSGSTVLGSVIGHIENAIHVGELNKLYKVYIGEMETCSCGELPSNCPFWEKILSKFKEIHGDRAIADYFHIRNQVEQKAFKKNLATEMKTKYKNYTLSLFEIISEFSGANIIVDSSKSANRAYALSWVFKNNLQIIYLQRNFFGIVNSFKRKRGNIQLISFLINQLKHHIKLKYIKLISGKKLINFNHEEIDQQDKLDALLNELNIQQKISVSSFFYNYHLIAGNRMRYNHSFKIKPPSKGALNNNIIDKALITLFNLLRKII